MSKLCRLWHQLAVKLEDMLLHTDIFIGTNALEVRYLLFFIIALSSSYAFLF